MYTLGSPRTKASKPMVGNHQRGLGTAATRNKTLGSSLINRGRGPFVFGLVIFGRFHKGSLFLVQNYVVLVSGIHCASPHSV